MAAALKKERDLDVQVIDGNHGEFTVSVDGLVAAQKGKELPSLEEILAAVRKREAVAHA